jgi:methyl-accepting chemotaxis protein
MRRRFLLALPLVVALLPACGNGTSHRAFTTDARVTLRTYTALVEQHLSTVQTAVTALAATQDAASGQWRRIEPALVQVADRVTTAAAVWFVRTDGSYYTVGQGLASANLTDRAYFPRLMAGQQVRGDLVVSKSTGKMSCIVAAPIRSGNRVVGGLGVSIDMVQVAELVDRSMALPATTVFYALDPAGKTALHIDRANVFEFPSAMGSETLSSAVRQMLASEQGTVTYTFKGSERTVVFMRSKPTGWVFALGTADASR